MLTGALIVFIKVVAALIGAISALCLLLDGAAMNRNLWACMRLIVIAFLALLSASSFAFPANFGDRWQGGSVLYATAQEACNAVESRTNTALQQNSTFWGCAYNLDPSCSMQASISSAPITALLMPR